MPRYKYTVRINPKQTSQGDMEAESQADVISKLTASGYFPISVELDDINNNDDILKNNSISKREMAIFTSQLSSLVDSGVNILNALNTIYNQNSNKFFKSVLYDISSKIKDGRALSDSLASYPKIFPRLYVAMIHSGEVGGTLGDTLKKLANFIEKDEEFKSTVKAAMTYPLFICFVGLMTIVVLFIFVIPKLVTMFQDMGQALPMPTQILIGISNFLVRYWWAIGLFIGAFYFAVKQFCTSESGRETVDKLKLKIKLLGSIILKTEIGRMSRTLSFLLASGIPILASLEVAESVLENQILKKEIKKFRELIKNGDSLSKCIRDSKYFPAFVSNIIAVGEETGTMEKSLNRIAEDYEKDVDRNLKALSRLLEPLIILFMGLIVGFVVISMLLPIFQINIIAK